VQLSFVVNNTMNGESTACSVARRQPAELITAECEASNATDTRITHTSFAFNTTTRALFINQTWLCDDNTLQQP